MLRAASDFPYLSDIPHIVRYNVLHTLSARSGKSKPFTKLFQAGEGSRSRTKHSLVVLRNRIMRRLRNDAKTEGRKVDRQVQQGSRPTGSPSEEK